MDRVSRLSLLFDQDEALLHINTGLRVVAPAPSEIKEPIQKETQTVDRQVSEGQTTTQVKDDSAKSPPGETTQQHPDRATTAPLPLKISQAPDSKASPEPGLESPDPLQHDGSFCPLVGVSRYPYKFLKDKLSQAVANRFFDRGQFWSRGWDV